MEMTAERTVTKANGVSLRSHAHPRRRRPARLHNLMSFVRVLVIAGAASVIGAMPALGQEAATPAAPAASAVPKQLPPVVVRGFRTPTQGSYISLEGAEAAQVPGAGSDAIKALQSLPGVVSTNDASSEPAVRGSRPSDNAYVVDFIPVGYLFHAGGLISVLPGDLVKSFDLHSAAFGPQFADVTGAVLDVSLRRPRAGGFSGQLDASLLAAGLIVDVPVAADQSFFLAARRSHLDLVVKKSTDENSGVVVRLPNYSDYQFKYEWRASETQRLTASANGARDRIDFLVPEGSTLGQQEPALTGESRSDALTATQALQWESDLGEGAGNRLAVGRTVTRFGSLLGSAADFSVRNTTTFVREQLRLKPAEGHELLLGGSLERARVGLDIDLRNARCTEFEAECDITSADRVQLNDRLVLDQFDLNARERWQFASDWALTTGVRHSVDRYLKSRHTEPRLGLEWRATPDTTFSAAWGLHNQQPAGEQIVARLGNPRLEHIRARHVVFGVKQQWGDGWSLGAEAYDKRLSQLVTADADLNYRNGGSGRAFGAELLLRKDVPEQDLSGWLSVSWARSLRRNDVTGERFVFEYDQPLIINLVARWEPLERWSFGAKWSFHSGSLDTPITGSRIDTSGRVRPVYGALNSQRLPPYHRLDLRADWAVRPSTRLYAELINAYNRKNIGGYSYNADYSSRKAETQLPLLISVGVNWRF